MWTIRFRNETINFFRHHGEWYYRQQGKAPKELFMAQIFIYPCPNTGYVWNYTHSEPKHKIDTRKFTVAVR